MSANDTAPDPPEWTTLGESERVQLRATPSANLVLAALAAGFVFLVAIAVVVGFFLDVAAGRAVSLAGLLVVVALLVGAYAVTGTRDYLLTSERVCTAVGLTDKRVAAADLADVRDVTVEQSLWQRFVNVGDIRFVTDDGAVTFALVESPTRLRRQALRSVEAEA